MLRFSLLAIIFVGAVSGRSQTEPKAEGCDYNLMFLEVGDSVYEGCEKCKCTKSGFIIFTFFTESLAFRASLNSNSWLLWHIFHSIVVVSSKFSS